jgi:hypothetical protein
MKNDNNTKRIPARQYLTLKSGNALSLKHLKRGITKNQRVTVIDDERGKRFIVQTRVANVKTNAQYARRARVGANGYHWRLETVFYFGALPTS